MWTYRHRVVWIVITTYQLRKTRCAKTTFVQSTSGGVTKELLWVSISPGLPWRVFQSTILRSSVDQHYTISIFIWSLFFIQKHTRSAVERCGQTSKAEEEAIANHLSSPGSNNKREARLGRTKKSLKLLITEERCSPLAV